MVGRWFFGIELPLTFEQFEKLPTNPAYKYEYLSGKAWLSPRPKECHALLELSPRAKAEAEVVPGAPRAAITMRLLEANDWEELALLFAGAFHRVQPFASLCDADRREAARQCLGFTRDGGDGPLIEPACIVAVSPEDNRPCGAIVVTLMRDVDLSEASDLRWQEPPPADWAQRCLGRPHLTWIFVDHWAREQGIGSALLGAAADALLAMGYHQLASTFMVGNDASTLWHWHSGFRLAGRASSWRKIHKRLQR